MVSSILRDKTLKSSLAGGGSQGGISEPKIWKAGSLSGSASAEIPHCLQLGKAALSYFEKCDIFNLVTAVTESLRESDFLQCSTELQGDFVTSLMNGSHLNRSRSLFAYGS